MGYEIHELRPLYTNQKSFYGKARLGIMYDGGVLYCCLRSYDTNVVSLYVGRDGTPFVKKLWNGYSATTMRHVNELLMQHDFPKLSARVWCAMEVGRYYHADEIPALDVFTR